MIDMSLRSAFHTIVPAALVLLVTCGLLPSGAAAALFLQGEDVIGPDGIVICVNEIRRTPFTGGLGTGVKQDKVEIQLTFVNTGTRSFSVDPLNDYSLRLGGTYAPSPMENPDCLARPFDMSPGTQSRGTLCFTVDAADTVAPRLVMKNDHVSELAVLCDSDLGRLMEQSASSLPAIDGTVKLVKFLIEAERLEAARGLIEKAVVAFPGDPRISLLQAMVRRRLGDTEGASDAIARIGDTARLEKDDALELARQAFELTQYGVAQKMLEPYAERGSLGDKELLFLARCWYFDRQYDRADKLLTDLYARGFQDSRLFFTLGNICEKRDDWRGALKWWEKAIEADPKYYEAEFNIGVAWYKLDERTQAIDHWRRVLILDPDPETREAAEDAIRSLE
ncbi:tetratricopeptide repeat protein [Candidatus Ozemobacteraceae bacterium]|nr:tetratricopeptide repeat protein [Candidatus Ozemobacteraceae bacterium]